MFPMHIAGLTEPVCLVTCLSVNGAKRTVPGFAFPAEARPHLPTQTDRRLSWPSNAVCVRNGSRLNGAPKTANVLVILLRRV